METPEFDSPKSAERFIKMMYSEYCKAKKLEEDDNNNQVITALQFALMHRSTVRICTIDAEGYEGIIRKIQYTLDKGNEKVRGSVLLTDHLNEEPEMLDISRIKSISCVDGPHFEKAVLNSIES